mgnify:CR=1 FL=1
MSIYHIGFMKNHHTRFRPYELDQLFLLPQDLRQWLPEDDLVYFIIDVVNELSLDPIYADYDSSRCGQLTICIPPIVYRPMSGALCMSIFLESMILCEKRQYYLE